MLVDSDWLLVVVPRTTMLGLSALIVAQCEAMLLRLLLLREEVVPRIAMLGLVALVLAQCEATGLCDADGSNAGCCADCCDS